MYNSNSLGEFIDQSGVSRGIIGKKKKKKKNPPASAGHTESGSIPGWEDPLKQEMATKSNILTRKVSWTEERDRL